VLRPTAAPVGLFVAPDHVIAALVIAGRDSSWRLGARQRSGSVEAAEPLRAPEDDVGLGADRGVISRICLPPSSTDAVVTS
jgi:hypothetical protein